MLELISSLFSIGDTISIEYGNPSKVVTGSILKILPTSIAMKLVGGGIVGVKGDEIITFSTSEPISSIDNQIEQPKLIETEDQISSPLATEQQGDFNKETDSGKGADEESKDILGDSEDKSVDLMPSTQYQVGDIIPLEVLNAIDPKLKRKSPLGSRVSEVSDNLQPQQPKKQKTIKAKPTIITNSFDGLASLVEEQHEIDNLQMVSAIGTIKHIREDRGFGFIQDPITKHTVFFNFNDIIDGFIPKVYQGVVYTETENAQGYKAIYIHRPASIQDLLSLAKQKVEKDLIDDALGIVEQILVQYPDNFDAHKAKSDYLKLYRPKKKGFVYKPDGSSYSKAKENELKKKYDEAIRLYFEAISNNNKIESAIKDLGVLFVKLCKSDYQSKANYWKNQAINLIDQYSRLLPNNISTWNYLLYNIYVPLGYYDRAIDIIDEILEDDVILNDPEKESNLLYIKGYNLLRLNKVELAKSVIEESLSINPHNSGSTQLLQQIESLDLTDTEQLQLLVSSTEFNILSGGLSSYIIETLENYDEYAGVKTKDIESRNFTTATLKDVRDVIAKAGAARAKERASYLLTEGKLMQELEPNEEIRLRTVMARYCNAMALSHISENSPLDIIRFYYNESFALEENWDSNVRQVALYLLTHVHSYTELINDSGRNNSLENILALIFSQSNDYRTWDNIVTMCQYNGTIFAQLFSRLYNNQNWRRIALSALDHFGVKDIKQDLTRSEFIETWNAVRENKLHLQKRMIANIKSLGICGSIEEAVLTLTNIRQYREDWIIPLDLNRINTIVNFILPALESFVKSSGYRNKESNYNNAHIQIQQLIDEIHDGPTKLSYEALLPLMDKLKSLLKIDFGEIVKMSEPKVSLKLLSTETVISDDGTVSLQISVENHKDSSPIKEVSLDIVSENGVTFIDQPENQTYYNAIDGGESSIFKVNIKVSNEIIANKATAINIHCKYKNGENVKDQISQVTLKLYSPEDYKPIDNPYAPIADGGPVPPDSPMFFGREEFIANIVDAIIKSQSKQIIIYGQKRSGKSSVMLHLKEKLQETGKTFCVFFSLGDIIQNLTEASFYHKILSSIQDELDDMEFNGELIPKFDFPSATDFKNEDIDNPLNTFTKYMTRFKRACKTTDGWSDRNLVVMIDEFTYLYTEIKKGHISPSIMKQWKAVTQNDKAQFSVVLVGQDVVPSFKQEDYARNAFGVIQDIRLTYLQDGPARELIEKPILDEIGESRYIGNAVSKIIEYTSRNPYYIQIFCARLVDYMNRNKSIKVTEADVNDVAKSFVVGEQALEEDKFDNLIRAGETEDLQEYPEQEILSILRQIAVSSRNVGYCCIDDINILKDRIREKEIIKHLIDREVLEQKGENNYKIQVRLFQEWLLNH